MAGMQPTTLLATALAALLGAASGHMIMNTPTPYNYHGTPVLVQVDPLGANLPFPCQGLSDIVEVTPVTAGGSQLVNFTGGAQHGGGSCQFAVTYEDPPPADKAKWKAIYTLIGGCPVSAAGNLPTTGHDQDGRADSAHCDNDSGTDCIRQFDVPIPKDLPNGNATFAWTWFNKIGNREMYMNCAPVTISGGSDDTAFFEALPDIFVANVAGECTTGNGVLNIPNPGKFGRVLEQPAAGSEGSCPKAAGVPAFEEGGGGAAAAGGTGSGSESAKPSETATAAPAPSASGQQPDLGCPAETSAASSGFVASTAVAPVPSATTGSGSGSGSGSGTGTGSSKSCSADGSIVCFGPTSYGLCANGMTIPQPVAPGTTCSNGKIARRSAKFIFW
ncbi:hypothetical protein VTK56DRAFT_578 [Thermocarpiscus australiensis]